MFCYCENNPTGKLDPTGMYSCLLLNILDDFIETVEEILTSTYEAALQLAEHHKRGTMTPSNKELHENGQARKKKDQGGEKKNQHKDWKPRSNKRTRAIEANNIASFGVLTVTMAYLLINDVTGFGTADDALIVPLGTLWLDFFS